MLNGNSRPEKKNIRNEYAENLQTTNTGEGVEKREPSCTIGGNVNWYSHYWEQYGGSFKN